MLAARRLLASSARIPSGAALRPRAAPLSSPLRRPLSNAAKPEAASPASAPPTPGALPAAAAAPTAASPFAGYGRALFFLLLLGASNFEEIKHEVLSTPVVPVVRLEGEIGSKGLSLHSVEQMLNQAFRMRRAVAVAVVVNSPGGSPAQSSLIAKRIRDLAEEKNLPVICFVEDMAASGGYILALAADEILCNEYSVVGSIGVIAGGFGAHRFLEKYGFERRVYTAGSSKSKMDPFKPENPKDVKFIHGLLDETHKLFINYVKERRGSKLNPTQPSSSWLGGKEKVELFNGDFWTANKAIQLGLVDGIGEIRTTIKSRFGKNIRLIPLKPQSWLESLITASANAAWAPALAQPKDTLVRAEW